MGSNVYQLSEYSCGYAAVKTLMVYLGLGEGYRYVYEPRADKPVPLKSIIAYAKGLGLGLNPYKAIERREEFFAQEDLPVMTMLGKEGVNHMVVVIKISKHNRVTYLDPEKGMVKTSLKSFLRYWDGIYLKVGGVSAAYKPNPKPFNLHKEIGALLVASLLPTLFLVGALLVKPFGVAFFSLAGLSLLSFVLSRLILRGGFNKLDKLAIPYLTLGEDKKERYQAYQNYKGGLFSLTLSASSFLALLISISFILALDSYKAVYLLLSLLGGFLCLGYLHNIILRKAEIDFAREENLYYEFGKEESLRKLLNKQKGFGTYLDAYKGLKAILLLLALLLYSQLAKVEIGAVIIYFFLLQPLLNNLDLPLTISSHLHQLSALETRLRLEPPSLSFHNKERSP